jgi:hypothetical protein
MPDLQFQVESAAAVVRAATPQLAFKVRITNADPQPIQSMALRAQIQIEPTRRRYTAQEQENLQELFGEPERWSSSLHPLLWDNVNVNVPGFAGETTIDVPAPCSFDFNVAVTKYIYGLEDGELPTSLLFSGTVFYAGKVGLQIAQIPWDRSANYRLPVQVWKEMMEAHYPNTAWICLRRDVFEKLDEFRASHGLSSWEQALEQVLEAARVKS